MGGALRLGGTTSVRGTSFISNVASSSGLAVAAVGTVEMTDSTFDGNVFVCGKNEYFTTREVGKAYYACSSVYINSGSLERRNSKHTLT